MATGTNEALGRRLRKAGRERPPAVPWAAVHVTPRNPDNPERDGRLLPVLQMTRWKPAAFPRSHRLAGAGSPARLPPPGIPGRRWPAPCWPHGHAEPCPLNPRSRQRTSLNLRLFQTPPEKSFSWGLSELHLIRWRRREWARQWPALGTPRPGKQRRWHHL